MKKIIVILSPLIISALLLSGCLETTINDYQDDKDNNNEENEEMGDIEDEDIPQPDENDLNVE